MNKLKLIIIFMLLLILGLSLKSLYDYKILSDKLIVEINNSENIVKQLEFDKIQLQDKITQQENEYKSQIAIIEKKCIKDDESLKYLNDNDNILSTQDEKKKETKNEVVDENQITGYGLQYLKTSPKNSNRENNE